MNNYIWLVIYNLNVFPMYCTDLHSKISMYTRVTILSIPLHGVKMLTVNNIHWIVNNITLTSLSDFYNHLDIWK